MVNSYMFLYFKGISKYTVTNIYYHVIILLIEYLPLFAWSILSVHHIKTLFGIQDSLQNDFYTVLLSGYTFGAFKEAVGTVSQSQYFILIPIGLLLLFFIICICLLKKTKTKVRTKKKSFRITGKVIKYCFYNFYDTLVFRCLNIYLIESILYTLIVSSTEESSDAKYILIVLSATIAIIHLIFVQLYYSTFHIFLQLNEDNFKYPYDTFSCIYDGFLFILKTLTCFQLIIEYQEGITLFIDIVIILLIFLYSIFVVISFQRIITNKLLNHFRLFLPLFNCIYLLFYIFFGAYFSISVLVIVLITTLLISLTIIIFKLKYEIENISKNKSNKGKCLFLIDELMKIMNDKRNTKAGKQDALRTIITIMIVSHEINCKINQCAICTFDLSKLRTETSYKLKLLKVLYKGIKYSNIDKKDKMYDLIELVIKIVCEPNHNYNNSLHFHMLIKKYKNKDLSMTLNIFLLHHFFLKKKKIDREKVKTMLNIINLTKQVKSLIKEFNSLIFVKEHTPLSFITSSLIIKQYRIQIKSGLKIKNEIQYNYNMIVIWLIIKHIFNSKMKNKSGESLDLFQYEDMLNESYLNYKYIVLNHNMNSKTFKIHNTGKEFSVFTNKNIEELFIKDMQAEVLIKLLEYLKQKKENVVFEFPIKDWKDNKFIQSFRVKFLTLPSICCESILISGVYEVNRESLLVFYLDKNSNNWNFCLYSQKLEKDMIVSVQTLNELNQNQKYIDLNSIFDLTNCSPIKEQVYLMNYRKYVKLLMSYFKYDKKSYEQTQSQTNLKPSYFKEKMIIKGLKNTYKILTNHRTSNIKTTIGADIENPSNMKEEEEEELDILNNKFEAGTLFTNYNSTTFNYSQSSMSHSLSSNSKGFSKTKMNEQEQLKESTKKKRNSSFRKFTILIILFNFVLLIITIIYLIVDVTTTKKFKKTFTITSELLSLEIKFLHSNLNFFSIMCIGGNSNRNCSNHLKKFNKLVFPDDDFDLRTYFFKELISKSKIISDVVTSVKTIIYGYDSGLLISILEKEIQFFFISSDQTSIEAKLEKIKFVDGLSRYSNMINMVIDDESLITEPIFLFTVEGNKVLFDNKYKEYYSQYQLTMYEFTLNYLTYLNVFQELKAEAFKLLSLNFESNRFVTQFFPLLLMGLHLLLYIICLIFIGKFESIVQSNIQDIMKNINDDKGQIYHFEKIKLIKQLSKFLVGNPNEIIKELNAKKSARTKEKMELLQQSPVFNSNKIYFSKANYRKITSGNKTILGITFIICFVYLIFFFIFTSTMIETYFEASNYISFSSGITSSLLSGVGILNIIMLSNRDDYAMNEIINKNASKGFIDLQISNVHQLMRKILLLHSKEYSFIPMIEKAVDLSCDTMFKDFNDSVLEEVNSKEGYKHLITFCHYYDFMKFKNEHIIIYEMGLRLHYLNNELEIFNDTKRYAFSESIDYFSITAFTLIVFRPLRGYYLDVFYPKSIEMVTSNNTQISSVILVINIIMEVLILLIIKFPIINSLLKKNSSLLLLNKCLQ